MPDDNLQNWSDGTDSFFENLPQFAHNAMAFEGFVMALAKENNYFEQANIRILSSTINDLRNCETEINRLQKCLEPGELEIEYERRLPNSDVVSIAYISKKIGIEISRLERRLGIAKDEFEKGIALIKFTFVGKDEATAKMWLEKDFIKRAKELGGEMATPTVNRQLDSGALQITCTFLFGNIEDMLSENSKEQ